MHGARSKPAYPSLFLSHWVYNCHMVFEQTCTAARVAARDKNLSQKQFPKMENAMDSAWHLCERNIPECSIFMPLSIERQSWSFRLIR